MGPEQTSELGQGCSFSSKGLRERGNQIQQVSPRIDLGAVGHEVLFTVENTTG